MTTIVLKESFFIPPKLHQFKKAVSAFATFAFFLMQTFPTIAGSEQTPGVRAESKSPTRPIPGLNDTRNPKDLVMKDSRPLSNTTQDFLKSGPLVPAWVAVTGDKDKAEDDEIKVKMVINNGDRITSRQSIKLNLTAEGLKNRAAFMAFSFDGRNFTRLERFQETKTLRLPEGNDGRREVFVRFLTLLGIGKGESQVVSDSIILDRTAPAGKIQINDGAVRTSSVNVTLNLDVKDSFSEDAKILMAFSDDGVNFTPFERFRTKKSFTLKGEDRIKTVFVRYKDEAGNTVDIQDEIRLERPLTGLPGELLKKRIIVNPAPNVGDEFGRTVAVSGDRFVVGNPSNDTQGTDAGAVFLYDKNGTLLKTIKNPTAAVLGDRFGEAVAFAGDLIIAGIPRSDVESGGVFIFDGDPQSAQFGKLLKAINNPTSPTVGDRFGHSVLMIDKLLFVGAPFDKVNGLNAGAVHIFDGDPASPTFGALIRTLASPEPSEEGKGRSLDQFGFSLAALGPHLVVSEPFGDFQTPNLGTSPDEGMVHIFDTDPSSPTFGALLKSIRVQLGNLGGEQFGFSVAVVGKKIAISTPFSSSPRNDPRPASNAGIVQLFDGDLESPTFGKLVKTIENPNPTAFDHFGLTMTAVGDKFLIGSDFGIVGSGSGTVNVYDSAGNLLQTLLGSTINNGSQFGISIAGNQNFTVVGSLEDRGTVTLFEPQPS